MKFKKALLPLRLAFITLTGISTAALAANDAANNEVMTGTVEVVHIDYPDHSKGEYQYFLNPGNRQVPVRMDFSGLPPNNLVPGAKISIKGQSHGRVFQVESVDAQASTSGSTTDSQSTVGSDAFAGGTIQRKAITLLVNMKNGVNSAGTVAVISGALYDNTKSMTGQYEASSNGQLGFARDTDGDGQADVFGPFTINADATTSCDFYDWAYKAEAAAEAAGIDLSQYQHKVFALPHYSQLTQCGWAGVGNLSCGDSCRAWVASSWSGLYSHELGHNLSMHHAGTDSDNNGALESEYGDASGIMGSPAYWNQFNAPHQSQMGWLAAFPGSTADVSGVGSNSYSLGALELDQRSENPGIQLLTHPRTSGGNYYISFRQTIGSYGVKSDYANKISVHSFAGGSNKTHLIKALAIGEQFSDANSSFSVSFHGINGNFADVSVTSNFDSSINCSASNPSLSLSPASQSGLPGDQFSYTLTVKNNDSVDCASSSFNLAAATGSLVSSLSKSSLSLAPGASANAVLTINSSTTNSDGNYKFTSSVVSSKHSEISSSGSVALDGTAPTAPANLNGSAKRKALNLSWSASSDAVSGVAYYRVFRNGLEVAQRNTPDYSDRDLVSGSSYSYYVDAVDHAGHISTASNTFAYAASSGGGSGGGGKGGGKPSKK
ncbi:MAG: hypothetical protein JKY01_02795 [Pseudomonadales bacterium]|nr:hypothetical protein [Pseudomonadales bacterium]